jgi:hypothetical protein
MAFVPLEESNKPGFKPAGAEPARQQPDDWMPYIVDQFKQGLSGFAQCLGPSGRNRRLDGDWPPQRPRR